jgi:hypothetical protein
MLARHSIAIENQKSKFTLKTPKRGQSAQSPDRLFRKKRLFLQSNFLGVTPAPQYSLKLTSNNVTVKRARKGTRYRQGGGIVTAGTRTPYTP